MVWPHLKILWHGEAVLQETVKGARRIERQKKRWEDNIKEWTVMGFGDSLRAVERWKGIVATSHVVPRRPPRLRVWERREGEICFDVLKRSVLQYRYNYAKRYIKIDFLMTVILFWKRQIESIRDRKIPTPRDRIFLSTLNISDGFFFSHTITEIIL